jgi:hypothetical protein
LTRTFPRRHAPDAGKKPAGNLRCSRAGGEGFLPAAGFLAGGGVGKRGEKAGRELYQAAEQLGHTEIQERR